MVNYRQFINFPFANPPFSCCKNGRGHMQIIWVRLPGLIRVQLFLAVRNSSIGALHALVKNFNLSVSVSPTHVYVYEVRT